MSAQAFEAALQAPDDNAACRSLQELLSKEIAAKAPALPAAAEAFLQAFCVNSLSIHRRRWIGIALASMIESGVNVASHLMKHAADHLARVGTVILDSNEAEETRIVAGLIIRAGLSQDIKFSSFWTLAKDKVNNLATPFPRVADTRWMRQFQDYMDMLSAIAPGRNISSQAVVLYPVALRATDGYIWSESDKDLPVLLIEGKALTIITTAPALYDIQFVDIPSRSIRDVRCQPSKFYDSQNRQETAVPWEVVLEFVQNITSYEVNCSEHSAENFVIIMQHSNDAKECMSCINEMIATEKSSDATAGSSSALKGNSKKKEANHSTGDISKGGTVGFDKSQPKRTEDSTPNRTRQINQSASGAGAGSARQKPGALPIVKKNLRPTDNRPSAHVAPPSFEFPDRSPSTRQSAFAKSREPSASQKDEGASQNSVIRSAYRKPAASQLKPRNQKAIITGDDGDLSNPSGLPKPSQKRATASQRQQTDVFNIPQEDEQGAQPSTGPTQAKTLTHKEANSSEQDGSYSEFAGTNNSKDTKRPRGRPRKTVAKKETVFSSPASAAGNKKVKRLKANTQPLSGSLSSNLRSSNAIEGKHPAASQIQSQATRVQRTTGTARRGPKAESTSVPSHKSLSSEAHILGKLNDLDSGNEVRSTQTHDMRGDKSATPRKRPLIGSAPSTPLLKKAKYNHETPERTAKAKEMVVKPPPMIAPIRVLQDPSSPSRQPRSSDRANRSMPAPPRPAVEDAMRDFSPRRRPIRSQQRFDQRQTPVHQLAEPSHSGMSATVELLSSNSKPTPASPHAASTAISGHADRHDVTVEKERGNYNIDKSNPFKPSHQRVNEFTRRLTGDNVGPQRPQNARRSSQVDPIELGDTSSDLSSPGPPPIKQSRSPIPVLNPTGISQSPEVFQIETQNRSSHSHSRTVSGIVQDDRHVSPPPLTRPNTREKGSSHFAVDDVDIDMEGDTLVNFGEQHLPGAKTSPVYIRSSPPQMDRSPSSHSSTSAEPEPTTDPTIPTFEADENEWENSLQPHQRNLKDQLLRVSNRVLRHIVDNESAVNDIADMYAKDGQHALNLLVENHVQGFEAMGKDVKGKKDKVKKASEKVLAKLRKKRNEIEDEEF